MLPEISSFHSLAVNFIRDFIHNHFHLCDVRIECFLSVSHPSRIWFVEQEKKSLDRSPRNTDALIED